MGLHGAAPHAAQEGNPGYVKGFGKGCRRARWPGWVAAPDGELMGGAGGPGSSRVGAESGAGHWPGREGEWAASRWAQRGFSLENDAFASSPGTVSGI